MTIDGFGRAAEIQINGRRTQIRGPRRVKRQPFRLAAEQLHPYRHTALGLRALLQLAAKTMKGT